MARVDNKLNGTANWGGCAVLAYTAVEYIKRKNPEANVSVMYMFSDNALGDYYRLVNNTGNGSCNHAVVNYDGVLFDSEGYYKPDGYYKTLNLAQDKVLGSISNPRHWNRDFDRRLGRKVIQKVFKTKLKITKSSNKQHELCELCA